MKVFIDRKIASSALALLKKNHIEFTEWTENREPTNEEFIKLCKEHDALLTAGNNNIDQTFLNQCNHLKVIALHSVGYDRVDVKEAEKLNIPIGNTPGVLSKATADTAFLLMLTVSRKAIYLYNKIVNDEWGFSQPIDNLGISLEGKTLGIFGLGNIGYELAKKCKAAFGMKIIYHNRGHNESAEKELNATRVSFNQLLEKSDVVCAFSALTKETKEKFNKNTFGKMKKSAIFINASRGGVHNEKDLIEALITGEIWGAGLDVTNPEPMKSNNPLLKMPTVAVFPHIGSQTEEARDAMSKLAAQNIIAGLKGQPLPNCINPEVYR